jgi:predicted small lipoprotein YifL
MKKTIKYLLVAILVTSLMSCGQKVYVQKDDKVDFSGINTYSWADGDDDKDYNTKRPNQNDLRDRKIHETIDKYLQEHGWKEVKNNPDVYMVFDVVVEKEIKDVSTPVYSQPFTRWYYNPAARRWVPIMYPSSFMGYDNRTQTVKEGTLTITLMDPNSDKVIWQGWSTTEIYGKKMTDSQIDKNVEAIVKKLKKF